MKSQEELSTEIRACLTTFNSLLKEANELRLRVVTKQAFHPLTNSIGAPLNPPLSASITETVEY